MLHAGREIHPVGPEIDVAPGRQIALSPRLILVPPERLQPPNGARRQTRRVHAQQRRQGLAEIARGDALQIKPRQQFLHRLGPAQVARQDRRGEADAPVRRIAVAHPRRLDPDRADPGLYLAFRQIAVAHNAATAPGVGQIRVGRDMALDFRFNRLRKQLTGTGSQNVRQRIIGK